MKNKNAGWFSLLLTIIVLGVMKDRCSDIPIKSYTPQQSSYSPVTSNSISNRDFGELSDFMDSGECYKNTSFSPKAKGVNMKIYYPCRWELYSDNDVDVPSLIVQYIRTISDSLSITVSLDIQKSPFKLTDNVLNKLLNKEMAKKLNSHSGVFIEYSLEKIGSVRGDVITAKRINPTTTSFSMIYHFYHNECIITITYLVISNNSSYGNRMFEDYKPLFKRLVKKTEFIN